VAALGPNGSDLYVVDTNTNFFKSVDGGVTWQLLAQGLYGSQAVVFDPGNPNNIYVLDSLGLQKSVDGGLHFATLAAALPRITPDRIQQIAVDASGALYAGSNSATYVSTDGGSTLTMVASTPGLHTLVALGGRVYAGFDTPSEAFVVKWDPTGSRILYSTFVGGDRTSISGLKADAQGNVTLTGTTYSPDFPSTKKLGNTSPTGSPSAFVTRLSPDGTKLVYSLVVGGSKGVLASGLTLDSSGVAYVVGQTQSADFPTTPNAAQPTLPTTACTRPQTGFFLFPNTGIHTFAGKLSANGTGFDYATFLTGSCGSAGQGIVVDSTGQVVVSGSTTSPDFPVSANAYQGAFPGPPELTSPPNAFNAGFVTRLSAAGDKIITSTYVGGGYLTQASALALDAAGNVAVTGLASKILPGGTPGAYQTTSVDRCVPTISIGPAPPPSGTYDAYVLKLDPTLSTARFLTYLGGGCSDSAFGIALDSTGNVWVNGLTASADFPLKAPFQGQGLSAGFVSELSADGSQLLFSSSTDGTSLAIDPSGAVYMAGSGNLNGTSAELIKINPTTNPAVQIDRIQPVNGFPPALILPNSFGTAVAPGELLRITGRNLGPATKANGQLDASGRLPFSLANTKVSFDGIPAPLISVQDAEIVCFAPFEISRVAQVSVETGGQKSNAVRVGVANTDPQILSIANQDGTPNSAEHPAQPGSVIVIYASGLGLTRPLSVDGLTNSTVTTTPLVDVTIFLPTTSVRPQFVGSAPGLIAGVVQINVAIPAVSYPSNKINISLNGAPGGTLYVAQ